MRPFDLIMTWKKGIHGPMDLISKIISWIIKGPSHVRVCCKGLYKDYDFFEMTWPLGRFGYLSEIDPKESTLEIGRHSALPYPLPQDRADVGLSAMKRLEGTQYDLGELAFSQFFDEIGLDHSDQSDSEKFVCSSAAEYIYTVMGYCFCPDDHLVSPQDLRKSKFYRKVKGGE